jgi:hypothetical protein
MTTLLRGLLLGLALTLGGGGGIFTAALRRLLIGLRIAQTIPIISITDKIVIRMRNPAGSDAVAAFAFTTDACRLPKAKVAVIIVKNNFFISI